MKGDLKDQLGLQHRNARKGKKSSDHGLEAAPMFHLDHTRSLSEMSSQHDYQPANTNSPGVETPLQMDTPPIGISVVDLPHTEDVAQYASLSPIPGQRSPVSPNPSYYSASEIPPSSPLPSPKYRYPDGQVTSTPPSRRASVATTRASTVVSSQVPTPLSSQSRLPVSTLQVPTSTSLKKLEGEPGAFEMRVRGPAADAQQLHPRSTSEASNVSYATAPDDFWVGDDAAHGNNHGHTPQPGLTVPSQQRIDLLDDQDDRATIIGEHNQRHDRQPSDISSWEGGRAL